MPDADSEDNARIGNLIILENDINKNVKNKPMLEKCREYQKSCLSQPKTIVEVVEKGNFDPAERESIMAERIFSAIH